MVVRSTVTLEDLKILENLIRRKETGLPGTGSSPGSARFIRLEMKKNPSNVRASIQGGSSSPLAKGGAN